LQASVIEGNCEPVEIDQETKGKILQESHDSVLGGHRGMDKTYQAIRLHYQWQSMRKDVEEYVKKCAKCQMNKTLKPRKRVKMEITTTARHPFEKCALDIVGPLTETVSGNRYILTFQDDLSKFIMAIPISQQDAETVAMECVLNIVLKFGAPAQILTDQGSNFLSELFKNVCEMLRIRKIRGLLEKYPTVFCYANT